MEMNVPPCEHCDGTGYQTDECATCGRDGYIPATDGQPGIEWCPECFGDASNKCPECEGTGLNV